MSDLLLNTDFFVNNRRQLFERLSPDVLIITAGGLLQKSADQTYPFRQDSNFWYLTGINEPDLILVKTAKEEFLIVPDFYVHRQSITSPLDEAAALKASGITKILSEKDGFRRIRALGMPLAKIATLLPGPTLIRRYGFYTNPARRQLTNKLKRHYPRADFIDARPELARLRMVKQPPEIKLIERAIDITTTTLKEVLAPGSLKRFNNTAEIEQAIKAGFISRGGTGHAFDPIVAVGADAALIHYEKLGRPLKSGELLVCDVGSRYSFYNADITRTVALGRPSQRTQDVYQAVAEVQRQSIKLIKPGINFKDYENEVVLIMGEQLRSLSLIKNLDKKSIRRYYPHACSHSLGIDVHDNADYSMPLPINMVMTVEPGIYIPEEGIGVRIEDVVLVNKDGLKHLSSDLPISLTL